MPENLPSVAQLNEDIARGLKQDGHAAAEVVRKMIEVHQLPERDALALVSRVFGKRVLTGGGDTGSMVMTGLALIAVGVLGCRVAVIGNPNKYLTEIQVFIEG